MSDTDGEYIICLCAECGVILPTGSENNEKASCSNCLNDTSTLDGRITCNTSREDYEKAMTFLEEY